MAGTNGGARPGAGAKPGNQNAKKRIGLIDHADRMIELAEKWLYHGSKKDQQWAFKELMPYIFSKQPQQLQHSGNMTVSFTRLVVEEVNAIHEGQEN